MRKVIAIRCESPTKAIELIKEPLAPNDAIEFERRVMDARIIVAAIEFDKGLVKEYVECRVNNWASGASDTLKAILGQVSTSEAEIIKLGCLPLNRTTINDYHKLFSNIARIVGPKNTYLATVAYTHDELDQAIKDTRNELWIDKIKEIGRDFIEISSAGTINYDWHKLKRHPKRPVKAEIKSYGAFIHAIENCEIEDEMLMLTVSDDRAGYGKSSTLTVNQDTALANPDSDIVVTFSHPPYYSVAVIGSKYYPIYAILTRKSKKVLGLLERDIPQYSINWVNEALGRLLK